jgi:hypothetical protein
MRNINLCTRKEEEKLKKNTVTHQLSVISSMYALSISIT